MVPRQNYAVNSTWMCDEGRLSYHKNNENRAIELFAKGTGNGEESDRKAA